MLTCSIEMKNDTVKTKASKLIENALLNCTKEMTYKNLNLIREEIKDEDGKIKVHNKLNASKNIEDFGFKMGIYFIISCDKNKILYIGKALDIKKRLKEHLIEKAESVSSEMFKINDYLRKTKTKSVFYYAYETKKEFNATIEGILIDYAIEQRDNNIDKYIYLFNERKD